MNKIAFCFVMIFTMTQLSSTQVMAADVVPVLAVFPIKCKSSVLKRAEKRGLTEYMATKLSEHGCFQVVPNALINKTIGKMISSEKKRSYDDSVDKNSRMAIGKELAAHYIVSSKISKVGEQCLLMSSLFDIEKASSVMNVTSKKACKPEQLILGIDEIVEQFQQKVSRIVRRKNDANSDQAELAVPANKDNHSTKKLDHPVLPQTITNDTRPDEASGQERRSVHGISAELMMGPNFCIPNGKADCKDIDFSVGTSITALFRIIDYLAIEAMFFYGSFDVVEGVSAGNYGLLAGVRGMFPIWKIDIMVDLDVGWQRLDVEGGGQNIYTDSVGLGFGGGAQYRIFDYLAVGLMLRYHLPFPYSQCMDLGDGNGETCDDVPDDIDQSHDFMFGISITGILPL